MSSRSETREYNGSLRSPAAIARFLQTVELFAELPADELEELVRVMQPLHAATGDRLWRQGEPADGLHVVVQGTVAISLRQPGGGELRLATVGAGEVLGEVPLLDGRTRSANARSECSTELLFLSRADFLGLTLRRHPTAFAVRRRICSLVCSRLRASYAELAAPLGPAHDTASKPPEQVELGAAPPPLTYLRRLMFFREFARPELTEVLDRAQVALLPPRRVIFAEGEEPAACYVTLNGAVEEAIERGERKVPVGLAGPGRAFGYTGLIDGRPCPLTATTRERSLVLLFPGAQFDAYFNGATPASYAMFGAIEHDLMAAVRRKDAGLVSEMRRTRQASAPSP